MSKGKKYQEGYVQGYEDAVKTEMVYKEKEKQELLLGLVPVANKGQELIPHKDYEVKQDGDRFYLVKKKKVYPKTYEECCAELNNYPFENGVDGYKFELLSTFQKLLICRDAYWKIAGEEMGLGKSWEPDWDDDEWPDMYYISFDGKCLEKEKGYPCCNMILIFPTAEMRDAFYENFKELIEIVKELL